MPSIHVSFAVWWPVSLDVKSVYTDADQTVGQHGANVRLLPNIAYGTRGYPQEIARRFRVLNIATWMAAMLAGGFAISFLASGSPEVLTVGITNAVVALMLAAIPLLNPLGALVAPLASVL